MKLEKAVQLARRVRVSAGVFSFPPDENLGTLAEGMHLLQVSLMRYRKSFEAFYAGVEKIEDAGEPALTTDRLTRSPESSLHPDEPATAIIVSEEDESLEA